MKHKGHSTFDFETSHVRPVLIRKYYEAKVSGSREVEVWGTGTPRGEFLHVDDLSDACLHLMNRYDENKIININVGEDTSIRKLAELIAGIAEFEGSLIFDTGKADGTPVKRLNVSELNSIRRCSTISLKRGIKETYNWCH